MSKKYPALSPVLIKKYLTHLRETERSNHTISKYAHDLTTFLNYLNEKPLTKAALIEWKSTLVASFAPATVNSMLVAVNGYLSFMGWKDLKVNLLKIQKSIFTDESRELSRDEYTRLVNAAKIQENERLALVLQTICATGIRVSELRFITVEAVHLGRAEIIIDKILY